MSHCELTWPTSRPLTFRNFSGAVSRTCTFAPPSAAAKAAWMPAFPPPHTTMSPSKVAVTSASAISGGVPSQSMPVSYPAFGLPDPPVGASVPPEVGPASLGAAFEGAQPGRTEAPIRPALTARPAPKTAPPFKRSLLDTSMSFPFHLS